MSQKMPIDQSLDTLSRVLCTFFKRASKTPATVLVPHDPSMYTLSMILEEKNVPSLIPLNCIRNQAVFVLYRKTTFFYQHNKLG